MKTNLASALVAAFVFCMPAFSHASTATINPTSDGSLYTCDGCTVVSDGGYVLVGGYIQGDVKFSSKGIGRNISQALLSLNPYGLPLWGPQVDIYGYGTRDGQLVDADANAGTFLGTLTLPSNLGYGQDVFFDVTSFVAQTRAPYLAFNLRSAGTDVFSSIEYNYGHPSQLWITSLAGPVPEPNNAMFMTTGLLGIVAVSRYRSKKKKRITAV